MPHTPNEPWKFPDGRQLTATTLNAMDMTPGDMDTILCALRIDHNPDAMRDMGLRGGALLSGNAEDGHNNMLAEERHRQQIDQANDRFDQERREQIQQQQMDARRAKEEAERRWAEEHRADQEQANRNLIAIPVALGGFALGLGLLPGAMDAAGEAMEVR
jgi:hypothetical protein